jgi:hypothetical protein
MTCSSSANIYKRRARSLRHFVVQKLWRSKKFNTTLGHREDLIDADPNLATGKICWSGEVISGAHFGRY